MYCHGTWTQWSLGRVTHVTSTNIFFLNFIQLANDIKMKTKHKHEVCWAAGEHKKHKRALSPEGAVLPTPQNSTKNDNKRGQRSSRGQWPLVQVFGKKGRCIHILWCIFKSNITMIAKVCDRESRRDTWFENRLVCVQSVRKNIRKAAAMFENFSTFWRFYGLTLVYRGIFFPGR